MTVKAQRCKEACEILRTLYNLFLMFPLCSAAVIPPFCFMYSPLNITAVHLLSLVVASRDPQCSAGNNSLNSSNTSTSFFYGHAIALHNSYMGTCILFAMLVHRSLLQSPANSCFNNRCMHLSFYFLTQIEHAGMLLQTLQQLGVSSLCHIFHTAWWHPHMSASHTVQ